MMTNFFENLANILGFLLLAAPCFVAGLYANRLNISIAFPLLGAVVVGVGVGLATALIECSVIMLLLGKRARAYIEELASPEGWWITRVLDSLARASRNQLMVMLVIGMLPLAYAIARPWYIFRPFHERLPEYLELAEGTPPLEDSGESKAPEQPQFGNRGVNEAPERLQPGSPDVDDDAPVQPQFGNSEGNNAPKQPQHSNEQVPLRESLREQPKTPKPSNLPVTGKILPVDIRRRAIDPVFFHLSDAVRPQRPDEVGAVAALWFGEIEVGQYDDKTPAIQEDCTVMVWDKRTKSLLAQRHFVGAMPPRWVIKGFPDRYRPYAAIRDYLNGLRR